MYIFVDRRICIWSNFERENLALAKNGCKYDEIMRLEYFQKAGRVFGSVFTRVAPDTELAGYPANNFAGYRI